MTGFLYANFSHFFLNLCFDFSPKMLIRDTVKFYPRKGLFYANHGKVTNTKPFTKIVNFPIPFITLQLVYEILNI